MSCGVPKKVLAYGEASIKFGNTVRHTSATAVPAHAMYETRSILCQEVASMVDYATIFSHVVHLGLPLCYMRCPILDYTCLAPAGWGLLCPCEGSQPTD